MKLEYYKKKYPDWYGKEKTCCVCGETKDASHFTRRPYIDEFLVEGEPRRGIYCLVCRKKYFKRFAAEKLKVNPEMNKLYKSGYLWRTYGLTDEDYYLLLKLQNNSCAICDKFFASRSAKMSDKPMVDHNHLTGKVRGIVCGRCNQIIALMDKKDDYVLFYYVISYLKKGNDSKR